MSDLKCEIQNESSGELTVGKVFYIVCDGTDASLDSKAELRLDKENQYKLKLLELETKDHLKLKVTSYVPGEHQLKAIQLVGEKSSVVLGDLQFSVKSVINSQEPPPEPYGPRGPIEFGLPLWYWIAFAVLLLALVYALFRKILKLKRTRQRLSELTSMLQGQTPYHFFRACVRRSQRQYLFLTDQRQEALPEHIAEFLAELEKAYRLFVGVLFQIETLHLRDGKIARLVSKKISSQEARSRMKIEVQRILSEFARAKNAEFGTVGVKDCVQIFTLLKKNTDELFEWHEKDRMRRNQ